MDSKSQTGLIGFIYKNKITLLLIIILFALVKQNIINNNFPKVVIDKDDVVSFLGKPKFSNTKAETSDQVGVVTGLAYTQFGGDTLSVEVAYYKGSGKLVLTGKLGDVMKESAMAALSYVKSNADKFGIDMQLFTDNDVHIHVPEGAVPKDGPSAGAAMTLVMYSHLSDLCILLSRIHNY